MGEDIVVRYKAEVDELLRKLEGVAKAQENIVHETKEGDKEAKKFATTQEYSAKKRAQLLELERKRLNELRKAQKLAFDPKVIEDYNKKIAESEKRIGLLSNKTKSEFGQVGGLIKSFAKGAALALGAAFSVDAIIQFGKASIDAFLDAEKNAERLKFAITTIGGESEAAFDRLIRQSSRMQEITVFSDDSIQQAQAALSAFGLTADEIERTIPLLTDYATVTGQDVVSAVQQIGAGMEGAGREFKKYGIEVSATATRQENLNNILKGFGEFAGAAENATKTLGGQLQQMNNRADELQETIGSKLAPSFVALKVKILEALAAWFGFGKAQDEQSEQDKRLDDLQKYYKAYAETIAKGGGSIDKEFNKLIDKNAEAQVLLYDERKKHLEKITALENEIGILTPGPTRSRIKFDIANIEKEMALVDAQLNRLEGKNKILKGIIIDSSKIPTTGDTTASPEALAAAKAASDYRRKLMQEEWAIQQSLMDQYLKELENNKREWDDLFEVRVRFTADTQGTKAALDQFEQEARDMAVKAEAEVSRLFEGEEAAVRIRKVWEDYAATIEKVNDLLGLNVEGAKEAGDENVEAGETALEAWREAIDMASQYADLLGDVAATYAQYASGKIEEINRVRDAELEAIDASLEANEVALDKRRISEKEAEETKKKLLAARAQAEEEAAKKERAIKRKQFNLDKAASIAQIGISMAEAFAKTVGKVGGVAGVVLAYAQMALLGVQLGLALAQPNPYKKGTKRSKSGLALVGEEGPELTYLPQGAKVLPKDKTNRYSEVIDAMYDGKLDEFIKANYMAPALRKEKAKREVGFAANVARAAMINPDTGVPALTYYDMEALRKKGTRLTDDTIERLADALSRRSINYDPYRR